MPNSLLYWCELYKRLKYDSLCLDIECTQFGGPISVIGLYQPKEGLVEYNSYIRGRNLTPENLRAAFSNCKMLITYNGLKFDVPKIRQEFPGVLPEKIPIIDLYLFAKRLGLNTNLKVLENTLYIERMYAYTEKRNIAVKLWKRYEKYNDQQALNALIEYNKQDTINLYPIAEQLVALAKKDSS